MQCQKRDSFWEVLYLQNDSPQASYIQKSILQKEWGFHASRRTRSTGWWHSSRNAQSRALHDRTQMHSLRPCNTIGEGVCVECVRTGYGAPASREGATESKPTAVNTDSTGCLAFVAQMNNRYVHPQSLCPSGLNMHFSGHARGELRSSG